MFWFPCGTVKPIRFRVLGSKVKNQGIADMPFMICSRCGKCCQETEMELSGGDIERLEKMGYCPRDFCFIDDGVIKLKNIGGLCYFYDEREKRCKVYEGRPLGCFLYPVVYLVGGGVIIDDFCPIGHTISETELKEKGRILKKLLKTLDRERSEKITWQTMTIMEPEKNK